MCVCVRVNVSLCMEWIDLYVVAGLLWSYETALAPPTDPSDSIPQSLNDVVFSTELGLHGEF